MTHQSVQRIESLLSSDFERFQLLLDEARYDVSPLGTGKNWVTKLGGLPLMVRAVAHALIRSGHSESSAIATAIAALRRWAAGGGDVHPSTRARAAAAIAHFDAMKAASHATRSDEEFIEYLVDRDAAKQRQALAILERRVGPHGYEHGWIKVGDGSTGSLKVHMHEHHGFGAKALQQMSPDEAGKLHDKDHSGGAMKVEKLRVGSGSYASVPTTVSRDQLHARLHRAQGHNVPMPHN